MSCRGKALKFGHLFLMAMSIDSLDCGYYRIIAR